MQAKWVEETQALRGFLESMSHNSELSPLARIFWNYAAVRALSMCLGPVGCKRCERCMRFLGYDIHSPAVREVCACALSIAYRHALKDPVHTIEDAKEAVRIISQGIQTLAELPERARGEHKELMEAINAMLREKEGSPLQLLQQGLKIYNKRGKGMGDWLHVGLPEIMQSIKQGAQVSEQKIEEVYQKWRRFGIQQNPQVKKAVAKAPKNHMGLFKGEKGKPLCQAPQHPATEPLS